MLFFVVNAVSHRLLVSGIAANVVIVISSLHCHIPVNVFIVTANCCYWLLSMLLFSRFLLSSVVVDIVVGYNYQPCFSDWLSCNSSWFRVERNTASWIASSSKVL